MKRTLSIAGLITGITHSGMVVAQDEVQVSAFEAPSAFKQTLENPGLPMSVEIIDRRLEQSPVADSAVWVYFLPDEVSISRIPLSARAYVAGLLAQGDGFLVRGRIEPRDHSPVVIVALLSRTDRSKAFVGCVAALEALRSLYGNVLFSAEEMAVVCSENDATS